MTAMRLLLTALSIALALPAAASQPLRPGQHPASFAREVESTRKGVYLLYLPTAHFEESERLWPLIVYLHGGGGRGSDPERLKIYPLPERLETEEDFPFVVISPQCPEGQFWDQQDEVILALIDHAIETYAVDPRRVYLMGHSMGAYGTWYLAHRFPERFVAIAPISGLGIPDWTLHVSAPAWVFHGAKDDAVPVTVAEEMIAALRERGSEVKATLYPEGGHVLREPTAGDDLFDWFLEHRLAALPAVPPESAAPAAPAGAEAAGKARVARFFEEVLSPGRLGRLEEFLEADGAVAFRNAEQLRRSFFPDLRYEIEALVAEGDRVVVRYTVTGTHTAPGGTLEGQDPIPPTQRYLELEEAALYVVAGSTLRQEWLISDRLTVARTLGFTVTPPAAPEEEGGGDG